jgi:hypothetical protein
LPPGFIAGAYFSYIDQNTVAAVAAEVSGCSGESTASLVPNQQAVCTPLGCGSLDVHDDRP